MQSDAKYHIYASFTTRRSNINIAWNVYIYIISIKKQCYAKYQHISEFNDNFEVNFHPQGALRHPYTKNWFVMFSVEWKRSGVDRTLHGGVMGQNTGRMKNYEKMRHQALKINACLHVRRNACALWFTPVMTFELKLLCIKFGFLIRLLSWDMDETRFSFVTS